MEEKIDKEPYINKLDSYVLSYDDSFEFSFDNNIILPFYAKRVLELTKESSKVLELGVGHGYSVDLFSKYYQDYSVLDGSQSVIEKFKEAFPHSKAKITQTFFENFTTNEKFDIIIMGFVLEHVDNSVYILEKYKHFLKKGGFLYVSVPNAQSLHRRIGNKAGLLNDLFKMSSGDVALGHQRLFSVNSLTECLEQSGFTITRKEGLFLKPFTTRQLKSLELDPKIINAMCLVGLEYPELCASILFEAKL